MLECHLLTTGKSIKNFIDPRRACITFFLSLFRRILFQIIKLSMARFLSILLLSFLIFNVTFAQDKLAGRVFENKTKIPLVSIKIENLKTHNTAVTDSTGSFSVIAHTGDYISLSGFAYRADTIYLTNLKYEEVFLEPAQTMLKEVKVVNTEIKTGSLKAPVLPGVFNSNSVRYQTDGNGDYIGGVKIMLWEQGNEKRKKRDHNIAVNEENELAIYNTFKPKNIQNYLPIKNETEMGNFIILYTPDVDTYYDSGFNLTAYLNTCYQKFLQFPAEQRQSKTFLQLVKKEP